LRRFTASHKDRPPGMDPASAFVGIEVTVGVLGALAKSRQHLIRLLDAVRGANDKKSVWYTMCRELGEGCTIITPFLQNMESEMREGKQTQGTKDAVEDILEVLNSALHEGGNLVHLCQSASTATLFFRGETMKEKFRRVAERIAQCLRSIPLASFRSTLALQRDIGCIVKSLETAR
jgi:hypothetical protein